MTTYNWTELDLSTAVFLDGSGTWDGSVITGPNGENFTIPSLTFIEADAPYAVEVTFAGNLPVAGPGQGLILASIAAPTSASYDSSNVWVYSLQTDGSFTGQVWTVEGIGPSLEQFSQAMSTNENYVAFTCWSGPNPPWPISKVRVGTVAPTPPASTTGWSVCAVGGLNP